MQDHDIPGGIILPDLAEYAREEAIRRGIPDPDRYIRIPEGEKIVRKPPTADVKKIVPPVGMILFDPPPDPEKQATYYLELSKDGLVVTENKELECFHYYAGEGAKIDFQMYLSFEARELVNRLGWKRVRELFESDLAQIAKDPFGARSLDSQKDDKEARMRRSVNRVSDALEDTLGLPVAVKGTGIGLPPGDEAREDLIQQYLRMRTLQVRSRNVLTDAQKAVFEFCPVYAAIRYPTRQPEQCQEWLIEKQVLGLELDEVYYSMAVTMGPPEVEFGFDTRRYPTLAKALGAREGSEFGYLVRKLRRHVLNIKLKCTWK